MASRPMIAEIARLMISTWMGQVMFDVGEYLR